MHELNQLRVLKCSMQREVQALSTRLKAIEAGEEPKASLASEVPSPPPVKVKD